MVAMRNVSDATCTFSFFSIMASFLSLKTSNQLRIIATLLTSVAALPAPSSSRRDYALPTNTTAASITWNSCPSEVPGSSSLQCASYSVPVNWDAPHGDHFDLGLVKLPAAASNATFRKIGSLFINPGGPGGSASQFVAGLALGAIKTNLTLENFDIIGLDPRGVGLSNQVQCDMSIYSERVSLFPQSEKELARLQDKNRRLGESCLGLTGPVLKHLDTIRWVACASLFSYGW